MQSRECTVTFKCEGCGMRKPEAERYRPRSAFTVEFIPIKSWVTKGSGVPGSCAGHNRVP
jgi:hypothetical protein